MAKNKKGSNAKKQAGDGDFERLDGFLLNGIEDAPDFRDYRYQPALVQLENSIDPPEQRTVLDQGQEGACTGFGLAAVINIQLQGRSEDRQVSARMLYEMAKKFDEWEGEDYSGSSCRGAVSGWDSMGVCSVEKAPYVAPDPDWALDVDQAKDARKTTLGAYYRVTKRLSDCHAALNEVGALFVSARVHGGWKSSEITGGDCRTRATAFPIRAGGNPQGWGAHGIEPSAFPSFDFQAIFFRG